MLEKQKQQKRTGSMQTRKRGVSALYVIGAALLSCAHITGVGAPFGVAFAAAACRAGYGFGAVLGTFAGYLLSMQGAEGVPYAGAALMTLAAATIFFGTRLLSARWFFPVMAAVSVAATGAVFAFAAARENCWERDKLATLRTLDSISGPLLRTGHISSGDFPGHFAAQCLRFSDFVLALNEGMDALFQRRQTQKKNEAGRKLIAQQYAGVTGILKQVGESMRSGTEILPAQEKELRTYAEAFGRVRTVAAWKDRRGRLHLELTGECVQRILRSQEGFTSGLGALMHVTLTKPETQYDSGGMRLMFREQEPYYITVGIGTRTREGQQISGDCVRYFTTEEGMACVILSDGMGSGEQAREESESTVRMAERFLRAGISAADCVRTIGPALKLRTQGKKFVTLDISTIDLFTGEAVSVKCGAAPSFVRAADGDDSVRVRRILSSTLPAGLEEAGDMDVTQFRMGSQDALVLLSDGIVDADGSNAGWVEELLADSVKLSARELAARLVLEGSARGAPDDMSAVVVYLGKRTQRETQEAGG